MLPCCTCVCIYVHTYVFIYCMFLMSSKLAEVYFSRGRAEWSCLLLSEAANASTVVSHSSILSLFSVCHFSLSNSITAGGSPTHASFDMLICVRRLFGYLQIYLYTCVCMYIRDTVLPTFKYEKKLFLTEFQ